MAWHWLVVLFVLCGVASWLGTWAVLGLLRQAVVDRPNDRSSHTVPTPRGGGIAAIAVIAVVWLAGALATPALVSPVFTVIAALTALAVISFIDDVRGLPAGLRLVIHAAAVIAGIFTFPDEVRFFQGLLPGALDHAVAGLVWLWFINLFNFMDGIDGISGVETIAIGFGVILVAGLAGAPIHLGYEGAIIAGAAAGFLVWNWAPARIFLGDVGSIGLGYLLGWLLLSLAAAGHGAAALILPAYYLADATITLLRRARRGEKLWQAHRSHFYQRAVTALASHAVVSLWIAATNLALIVLAVLTAAFAVPIAGLIAAIVVTAALLWYFASVEPRAGNDH